MQLLRAEAQRRGLPPEIADAVVVVERGYNADARGNAGEVGLMQVMPATAAMLGFGGGNQNLAEPATNIRYGVDYLAGAWRLANRDLCRVLMKYRPGHGEECLSKRSVAYCRRARAYLAKIRSPLAGSPLPEVDISRITLRFNRVDFVRYRLWLGPKFGRNAAISRKFWTRHEAR